MPLTIADLMTKMPGAFVPEKAQGLNTVLQFKFSGAEPGEWYAEIKDGPSKWKKAFIPPPR